MDIRRILFPVDFSASSTAVAPFIHAIARRHQAAVVLLHVIPRPLPLYGGVYSGLGSDPAAAAIYSSPIDDGETRRAIQTKLDEFAAAEFPKLDVTGSVEVGDAAHTIVDFAQRSSIDLICMPTRGHGAFRRALLGSVTAKVLRDAHLPVWMAAHAPEPSHRAHPEPRHILAAIDPEGQARETLEAAVAIAKETGAGLDIVTAVAEGMIAPGADPQLDNLLVEGTREELAKLQFEAGTQVNIVIGVGGPANVVRDAALSKRADLVICGRASKHGVFRNLRDANYAIIREAPCPVLSL